jgi:DDE superfamily endonuclease
MEEVLDLYQLPPDPLHPLVCVDESHKEQRKEVRHPEPMEPGKPARYDHEYKHNGMSNLFMMFAPHHNWRHVKVTESRNGRDFAECLRDMVDVHFPDAQTIELVMDNLNTHSKASLYAHFPPQEAHRIASKLMFHYTPKHGSWLNMAEIELSVLGRECLSQRIPDRGTLSTLTQAWAQRRNDAKATIRWQFTTADARIKLERLYPCLQLVQHDN